jgi:tRNA(Ile)-lysidine synthase
MQEMVHPGERLAVAVSGGADSTALLLLLLELRERLGVVLSVVHFNHLLRGRASVADEAFVRKLAEKHGLPFCAGRADVAAKAKRDKANLEDAARRARYAYFAGLVDSGQVNKIAVAHTADDQAETLLAHILRGTGLAGLGGIHPVAGHVLRPLLGVRRAELRAYLRSRKQAWREDLTNRDTRKMRARIRKKLLPLLEKEFQPAVVEHLATLAELAREDEALLDALTEEGFARLSEKNGGNLRIPVGALLAQKKERTEFNAGKTEKVTEKVTENHGEESKALSARLVRRIVAEVKPQQGQLGADHVRAVLHFAAHGENGKCLQLPGGVEVRRERDTLLFCARDSNDTRQNKTASTVFSYEIALGTAAAQVRVPELGCVFRLRSIDWPAKRGETSLSGLVLDRDALRSPLILRNWRAGDKFQPAGHRAACKLKRLLNRKRVSRWERDGWPVLTSGGDLAWARGFPVATQFAASERTRAGIVIAEEALS